MQKYEWIWRGAFLIILGLTAMVMNKVYIFQTHHAFDGVRRGVLSDFAKYSVPFSVAFTVTLV